MFLFFWLFMKETPSPVDPGSRGVPVLLALQKERRRQAAAGQARRPQEERQEEEQEEGGEPVAAREVNGSKPAARKAEPPPPPVTKQPSPPPAEPTGKKRGSQRKQKSETVVVDEPPQETKVDQAPVPVKKDVAMAADAKVQDGAPTPAPTSGKKKNSAKKQKTEPGVRVPPAAPLEEPLVQLSVSAPPLDSEPQKGHGDDAPAKTSGKKLKNETDKGRERERCSPLGLALSEEEAVSVAAVLREKSPSALDAWHRSAAKCDPLAQQLQERERLLTTLQEEASIAKEKVKHLSQELQVEKQKTGRAEAMLREQRGALEKELSVMQSKAQGSYQEAQGMQMKFQQLREQLEGQIGRLQQENGILRDAVSNASNQMESKQAAELNKLRSECAGLMKELGDNSGKLQQEELQRKSLEVNYKQNVSQLEAQLQDAKRRWEELQNFLHSVNTEREKLQAAKQELQSQLLGVESEMSSKNQEIQNLHSRLTDTLVSKEQLEHKVMELLEATHHTRPDDAQQLQDLLAENKALKVQMENLQAQLSSQTTTASHFDELQKLLADKELQRKSLEDSLNAERSSGASRETDMQAMHTDNLTLKAELQKLQAQISEQAEVNQDSQLVLDQFQKSAQEKEEKIKMVETLLEAGLIEMANKEEELKTLRTENDSLKQEMDGLQQQATEQTSSHLILEELHRTIQDKDERMRFMEEKIQAELESVSDKEKSIETLEQSLEALRTEAEALRTEAEQTRDREALENTSSSAQLQELQMLLAAREEAAQRLQRALEERAEEAALMEQQLKALQEEGMQLREQLEQQLEEQHDQKPVQMEAPSQELLMELAERSTQVSALQSELEELRASLEMHRKKNNELREKNWSAMEALAASESMLQTKLSKTSKESQEALEVVQAECRELLHRVLPSVPLPASQSHQEWMQMFESAAKEVVTEAEPAAPAAPGPESEDADVTALEGKLKEAEDAQKVLQKDCETYKKVLAETEGILQRLQDSVEQEESRWRVKLESAQSNLQEMSLKVASLESEAGRLDSDTEELESLRRDKRHLESELERAERESATYVTEVRELKDLLTELQSKLDGSYTEAVRQNEELNLLKTQLTETLSKLETEESERQKVAGDLYKAQESLDLIQAEILKETGQADLIENSTIATQREETDRKEKMTAGLNQTVRELQQLLQTVNRQLTKRQEGDRDKDAPEI
ncbi:hypothetical protein AAFF_G00100080 [Aldrovandia affinis]|uniref:Kinectin 1 n=1 Tax=Aldrovandia affinis TaxID=143900 RepID=A0AAD7RXN0_9TELE|nr:hypothetical protein AAFF_G00100080 [Aldrovandia affinis]